MPVMSKFLESRRIKAEKNRVAEEMLVVSNRVANECGEIAKQAVKYPQTYERSAEHVLTTKVMDEGDGNYSMMVPFSSRNSFNVPVEHYAICKFDMRGSSRLTLISVH